MARSINKVRWGTTQLQQWLAMSTINPGAYRTQWAIVINRGCWTERERSTPLENLTYKV